MMARRPRFLPRRAPLPRPGIGGWLAIGLLAAVLYLLASGGHP